MVKNLPAVWETWFQSLGWEDPLEKGMANYSSILAWRIPGKGKPGGLLSMGSYRVGQDWSDLAAVAAWPYKGFPCGSAGKESACNTGDLGLIPGLGRSPGEGNGYSLQYSCLENSMDRGAWQARQLSLSNGMVSKIDHFWWHNHRMTAEASC